MVFIYKRNHGIDLSRCRASVTDPGFMSMVRHQCRRKPVVFEIVDGEKVGLCKTHSTAETEKRNKASLARYDAAMKARERPFKQLTAYRAALQLIVKTPHAAKDIASKVLSKFEKD